MTLRRLRAPRGDEQGAVAVMVAVLAVVLLVVAALAVDLGNAWARGRIVQKQVDVSAIGAGSLLPMSVSDTRSDNEPLDIATRAAELLNRNRAAGQDLVTPSDLLDLDAANGEVRFLNAGGVACTDRCVRLAVTAPGADVDFGLAGAVSPGTVVSRSATVEVFSELPPLEKVVPLWVPSGCGYGPVDGDTTQGGGDTTSTSAPSAATTADLGVLGDHVLTGPAVTPVAAGGTATVSGYGIGELASNIQKATIRLVAPDGSRYVDYASSSEVPRLSMTVPPFEIGTEVTITPGEWRAYAMVEVAGNNQDLERSSSSLVVEVNGTVPADPASATTDPSASTSGVPVGCAGQDRGNFGQLDSPRKDAGNNGQNTRLAWNLAFGIDHVLTPFDTATYEPAKECASASGNDLIPGAVLDDQSRDGANCIKGDTGNDGPALYDGLIEGVDGRTGRLDAARGGTSCTGSTRLVGGRTINDDRLDCFLRGGATLETIAQETGVDDSMLDASVKDSPRFVWLPMVLATDRAQRGFQPVIDYVPAFITDQTQTAPASVDNGLQIDGNSVKVIRFFTFNKAALPVSERSPSTAYRTTLDRPIVRLVG